MREMKTLRGYWAAALLAVFGAVGSAADTPVADTDGLLPILRKGGCYIVMRHASSPRDAPSVERAAPGNPGAERQLDARGKETARQMGLALRQLRVPVTAVLSSPTWRARETAMEAGFPKPELIPELGDGGNSMAATDDAQAVWLRRTVSRPRSAGNAVLITHSPNLRAAFPQHAADLADGEALIFAPDASGGTRMLRRMRIEEWGTLADRNR